MTAPSESVTNPLIAFCGSADIREMHRNTKTKAAVERLIIRFFYSNGRLSSRFKPRS
jgi:hypothetical protein